MEDTQTSNSNSNKQRRNKIVVTGVCGIAGILILGGAFAVANLIKNRTSKKGSDTKNPEKAPVSQHIDETNGSSSSNGSKEEGSEGLRSLLQTSSLESPNSCRSNIDHEESMINTVETPVKEEKQTVEVNVDKQISTFEDLKMESEYSKLNAIDVTEAGIPLPNSEEIPSVYIDACLVVHDSVSKEDGVRAISMVENGGSSEAIHAIDFKEIKKDESGDDKDVIDITDDGASFTSSEGNSSLDIDEGFLVNGSIDSLVTDSVSSEIMPNVVLKGNSLQPLNEEEEEEEDNEDEDEDEDEDDNNKIEGEGEHSEGTQDSSTESNSEAIWPVESEEELSLLKDSLEVQNLVKKIDKITSKEVKVEASDLEMMSPLAVDKENGFKLIHPPSTSLSRPGFWLCLLLAMGLLYLLLVQHPILFPHNPSASSSF